MASSVLANRVRVVSATTGTGTLTLGAKVSNRYVTFAEGGITDAQVVTYCIEEGDDFEIGRGTYTSSGTTLSRDTVLISSVGGTVGTSKLDLAGTQEVFITTAKEDFDVNDFTEDTTPLGADDFHWMHDASDSLKKKVKPANLGRTGGLQLLNSGTVTNAATLDIVLTGFTAYRGLLFALTNFIPATDGADLWMRLSTNGGSSYDAGASDYRWTFAVTYFDVGGAIDGGADDADSEMVLMDGVGNGAAEGCNVHVNLMGQTSTANQPRMWGSGSRYAADDQDSVFVFSGRRLTAQDTDAVRFMFSTGNIASGNWAVYGFA